MAKKSESCVVDKIAQILVVVGGLNWGLVALGWNLVTWITFGLGWLANTIYGLVGLSALWMIYVMTKK